MIFCASTWNYFKAEGSAARLDAAIDDLRRHGLGAELWLDWLPEPRLFERPEWGRLRELCRGLPGLSAHSSLIQRFELQTLLEEIELCGTIGADPLVIHPRSLGLEAGAWDADWAGSLGEDDRDRLERVLERCSEASVRLALENGPMNLLQAVLDAADGIECGTQLGICVDSGHANMHRDRYDSPAANFVQAFGNRLIHMHLADNAGLADDHLVPGEGNIDWNALWRTLRSVDYQGLYVLELNTADPGAGARRALKFLGELRA
jgi:sugar phosphate isomerase/epimerase